MIIGLEARIIYKKELSVIEFQFAPFSVDWGKVFGFNFAKIEFYRYSSGWKLNDLLEKNPGMSRLKEQNPGLDPLLQEVYKTFPIIEYFYFGCHWVFIGKPRNEEWPKDIEETFGNFLSESFRVWVAKMSKELVETND